MKAEMHIGSRMMAGEYSVGKAKAGGLKWQFKFENTREVGIFVFSGFQTKKQCKENAELMGVEFMKDN